MNMPLVKKVGNGYIIVNEFTGIPMYFRKFRSRAEAEQAASQISGRGY